nr:hypothetical protein [Tanacetum cinerariifolium]
SKLLIDELDLPSDFFLSFEYDSFLSEYFSKVDALLSTNNEDKVFNLGILIKKTLFEVITRVAPDKNAKKLAISHASLILEDFDPPLYKLPFSKEVPSTPLTQYSAAGQFGGVTDRALIDVHGEEMIFRDGDERLTLNMRHDTSSYSNQPQKESINMINIYDDSSEDFLENLFVTNHQSGNPTFSPHPNLTSPEVKDDVFDPEGGNVLIDKLLDLDSTKDLHPPYNVNPLSDSTTSSSSSSHFLEEFADELALITFPPGNDDLLFDIESDHKEIEYLLHHDLIKDMDSIIKDSVDQSNLADLNDNLVDTMPEMFTDEHALHYSSPPLYDEYDDDLFEDESDTKYVYDDPFDSKGEKIKESKLLIDELDLPSDFLPSSEYDSFLSEDFPRLMLCPQPTTRTRFLIRVFDPPLYELPFLKEVFGSETLLSFSSENEEKVFKPEILTSKGVHSSLIPELSHRGYKIFKSIKILKSPMEIFLFSCGENIRILVVPCLHFYPP